MTNQKNMEWALIRRRAAFSLIELLVVISIIAILVAFTIPVIGGIRRQQAIKKAQSELEWLSTAIDSYKAVYGYYPPSNPKNVLLPPLFYELTGVNVATVNNKSGYVPLDGNLDAFIATSDVQNAFGLGGFMNCSKGGGEEGVVAHSFLTGLKGTQFTYVTNNGVKEYILITSLGGPNVAYQPIPGGSANPFRYNSLNPTNNPQSYDLWIDLMIGSKTNRVSNWTKQVISL